MPRDQGFRLIEFRFMEKRTVEIIKIEGDGREEHSLIAIYHDNKLIYTIGRARVVVVKGHQV